MKLEKGSVGILTKNSGKVIVDVCGIKEKRSSGKINKIHIIGYSEGKKVSLTLNTLY